MTIQMIAMVTDMMAKMNLRTKMAMNMMTDRKRISKRRKGLDGVPAS